MSTQEPATPWFIEGGARYVTVLPRPVTSSNSRWRHVAVVTAPVMVVQYCSLAVRYCSLAVQYCSLLSWHLTWKMKMKTAAVYLQLTRAQQLLRWATVWPQ